MVYDEYHAISFIMRNPHKAHGLSDRKLSGQRRILHRESHDVTMPKVLEVCMAIEVVHDFPPLYHTDKVPQVIDYRHKVLCYSPMYQAFHGAVDIHGFIVLTHGDILYHDFFRFPKV